MKRLFLLVLIVSSVGKSLSAQLRFDSLVEINFIHDLDTIYNVNVGGFSNPTIHEIDLNNDGVEDFFFYDNKTYPGTIKTFINNQSTGGKDCAMSYAPEYEKNLPFISSYAKTLDMNCDGITDLIERGIGGVSIHYGMYDNNQKWKVQSSVETKYYRLDQNGLPKDSGNIYVAPNGDIPLISDLDNDGDMDILSFDVLFPGITLYRNHKVERNLPCSQDYFILETFCFDNLERLDSFWNFNYTCKRDGSSKTTHSLAVALESFDVDGDGDLDIFSGSNNTSILNTLYNNGSATQPMYNHQDTVSYSTDGAKISIDSFVMPNLIDYNNDGTKDMVITNLNNNTRDFNNFISYKNSSTSSMDLELDSDSYFKSLLLDLGTKSSPVLFDHDRDGDLDLFIAIEKSNNGILSSPSHIVYYENIGTTSQPYFSKMSDDFENLSSLGLKSLYPSFGDINNDGTIDLFIGHKNGFAYALNTKPSNQAPNYLSVDTSFSALDSARLSYTNRPFQDLKPCLYDLDKDGDQDLICGEKFGNLFYFENQGTSDTIYYKLSITTLGLVDVSGDNDPFYSTASWEGYSVPWIGVVDSSDSLKLLVGSYDGNIYQYLLEDNAFSSFTITDTSASGSLKPRLYSAPTSGDLYNSKNKILITGNFLGGISCLTTSHTQIRDTSTSTSKLNNLDAVSIWPNPSSGRIHIEGLLPNIDYQYQVLDIIGRKLSGGILDDTTLDLTVSSDQVYLIHIIGSDGSQGTFKITME